LGGSVGIEWELRTAWNSAISIYLFADGRAVKDFGVDRSGRVYLSGEWSSSGSTLTIHYHMRRSGVPHAEWSSVAVDEREEFDGKLGGVLTSRVAGSKDPPQWKSADRETLRRRNLHPSLLDGSAFR